LPDAVQYLAAACGAAPGQVQEPPVESVVIN
jgi:hypothetical protein